MIAVALAVALIVADRRYHQLDSVRNVLSTLSYPLILISGAPVRSVEWLADSWVSRDQLQEQYQQLHRENLTLRGRLQRMESLEAENMRLRDLVSSSFKIGDRVLIAELERVDLNPYRHQVMVNKGNSSGVFVGQPALDAHGVMGQVIRVTSGTSTILMITDAEHALPVQVNRNGLRTTAQGTGFIDRLQLLHLPKNTDITKGDLLVTSGLGGHFPPGYPVAEVSEVRVEPGKPFATVTATPSAHLERTREVLLVWSLTPEQAEDVPKPADQPPDPAEDAPQEEPAEAPPRSSDNGAAAQ